MHLEILHSGADIRNLYCSLYPIHLILILASLILLWLLVTSMGWQNESVTREIILSLCMCLREKERKKKRNNGSEYGLASFDDNRDDLSRALSDRRPLHSDASPLRY